MVPHLYCIGDVIGKMIPAHAAGSIDNVKESKPCTRQTSKTNLTPKHKSTSDEVDTSLPPSSPPPSSSSTKSSEGSFKEEKK
ncbi:hypothetical protein L1987_53887 [Smallanthus sonchifolius]|uniref:Uncharacterized protein n=1 Tax=Smallanthus sonchifolius TaxID=185202 RepID=A0ACB9EXW6_9ASTR|nr:hypothetical protein L1987_53887 [Smallanthus sonchifolius]